MLGTLKMGLGEAEAFKTARLVVSQALNTG